MIEVSLVENLKSVDIYIHFYFKETDIHSMNAFIFNECEKQFIKAIKNIDKYLKEPIEILVYAKEEGGLKERLKVVINNPLAVGIVCAIIGAYCNTFFNLGFEQKLPVSQETKNKLENILNIKNAISSNNLTEDEFVYISSNDKELRKLRSNFFSTAIKDETLLQVEIDTDTQIGERLLFDKIIVPYEKFNDFIIKDDDEQESTPEIVEKEVRIYIIAPILVEGRKDHWKGFLNGGSIDFILSDKEFLQQVYSQEIKFGNGTYLDCKLRITTTIKMKGKEEIINDVFYVKNSGDEENFVRPIKRRKRKQHNQGLLQFD